MIDTLVRVETPEGVELELSPAGPLPRLLAWLLDLVIRIAAYGALGSLLTLLGRTGLGILLVLLFVLEWGYPVGFELLNKGQTPGKRALGLKVVMEDGTPVTASASMVRSLIMTVDFLPFFYGTGLVAMAVGREFRRLGDLAAGTRVVHAPARSTRSRPLAAGPVAMPPFPLALEEQRAILDFAERVGQLTSARAEELAALLEPVTGATGPEGVAQVMALARGLRGQA